MSAWLAGTGSINPATNASRQDRTELLTSDSFMFASPEKLALTPPKVKLTNAAEG
jgi:hypothetical protein